MAKRKGAALSGFEAESSKKRKGKHEEKMEEDITSKGKTLKLIAKESKLLRGEEATRRYISDFAHRKIMLGRGVDFDWLRKEDDLEIDNWLFIVGWNQILDVKEVVYPNLVKILYANLDPNTMTSYIGNTQVDLSIKAWSEAFHLPELSEMEETQVRTITREELFFDLTKKRNQGVRNWININELPQEVDIRLIANILMNAIIPKLGSREQIKEEERRVLYALKYGSDLNLGRIVVERIRYSLRRSSVPLCYGYT